MCFDNKFHCKQRISHVVRSLVNAADLTTVRATAGNLIFTALNAMLRGLAMTILSVFLLSVCQTRGL